MPGFGVENFSIFGLMKLLADLHYFPSIIFYKNSYNYSHIVFDQYECYQKMSFRNRCVIAGANGTINLSIPLREGRNQKAIMKDIRIAPFNWQVQHWRSIESCYNKSPWFGFFKEDLFKLYSMPFDYLLDWNLACFEWGAGILHLPMNASLTEQRVEKYGDDLADFRNMIRPKNYQEFPPVVYHQVFEDRLGFIPNLSILDLIFCEGSRAKELLMATN
jgi:hypothetical protein